MNIEAEKNNLIVLKTAEEMISLIKNNEYEQIDAIKISDFLENVEKIVDPELKNIISQKAEVIKEIFVDNKLKINNDSLNKAVDSLEAIRFNIAVIDVKRASNNQAQEVKDSLERREEQYRSDYRDKQNEEYLRGLKNKRGERVYSEEDISSIETSAELDDLVTSIKNLGQTYPTVEPVVEEIKDDSTKTPEEIVETAEKIKDEIVENIEEEIKKTEEKIEEDTNSISEDENEEIIVNIDELNAEYNEVEREIIGYIQANNAKLNVLKLRKERLEEQKQEIGHNEEKKEELEKEFDRQIAEVVKEIRSIINPSKEEQLRIREEKDKLYRLATMKIQKLENLISELKRENRRLEFEHSEMVFNGITDHKKWHYLTNKINENTYKIRVLNEMIGKYNDLKEELKKTEKIIKLTPEEPEITPKEVGDAEVEKDEPKDFDPTIEGAIKALIESLDKDMTPEEIKDILAKIEILVYEKYNLEQAQFQKNLNEAKTVEDKLEIITKREAELFTYVQLLSHPTKEKDDLLEATRNKLNKFIKTSYETSKENGEYCWKEFKNIKESRKYIFEMLEKEPIMVEQFKTLMENMEGIIANPNPEEYENWKMGMQQFVEKNGLEADKMLPYINARAKIINQNVTLDNEFNIEGLNLDNGKNKGTENNGKKRRKVTKVKDAKGFFKKHPKLKVLAIGLAVLLGSQLGLAGVMMINSALWSVLGGQGAICGILHAINLGLSKIVGAGLFQFTQAGTYTFLGQTGALSLYSGVGAKLTAAAAALGIPGTIIAKKIKNKNEKKTSWLKEKIKNRKWFKRRKDEEIEEQEEKTSKEELEEMKKQAEEIKKQQYEENLNKAIEDLTKQGLSKEEALEMLLESQASLSKAEDEPKRSL